MKCILSRNTGTNGIRFYFDGASWTQKTSPCDQARSTIAMAWRKKSVGLALKCITKGKEEGYRGKSMIVFVAISHGHGVVLCEQRKKQLTGQFFRRLCQRTF